LNSDITNCNLTGSPLPTSGTQQNNDNRSTGHLDTDYNLLPDWQASLSYHTAQPEVDYRLPIYIRTQ